VLRALGLGDFLTAVPALRALSDAFPGHRRVLAAPAALEPLARLSATVDELVDTAPLAPIEASLQGAEVAVNLHGRGPQSLHLLRATHPRRLIAFDDGDGGPRWRPGEHEVRRWCRLLEESGIPADPTRLELPPPPSAGLGRVTVIHPGAASAARRWPPQRWAAVARHEVRQGRTVVVTGGPDERRLAVEVAEGAGLPNRAVLAGRTDLLGLAGVVAGARVVLCGDTGVAHLATAFGTPSAVLFGPVPPSEWGPPTDRPQHVAIWAGRRGDPHATEPDPGLLEISVGDVVAAVAQARPITSTMRST